MDHHRDNLKASIQLAQFAEMCGNANDALYWVRSALGCANRDASLARHKPKLFGIMNRLSAITNKAVTQ